VARSFDQLVLRLVHEGFDTAASQPNALRRTVEGRCWRCGAATPAPYSNAI
jgi:hypothetical protein